MAGKLRSAPLIIALVLALGAGIAVWWFTTHQPHPVSPTTTQVADLGSPPDWSRLDPYQGSITREGFTQLIDDVYTIGPRWKEFIKISDSGASITTFADDPDRPDYKLTFATENKTPEVPRFWKSAEQLDPAPADKPLQDLHIAIDPGHIGGEFAQIEERWFQIGDDNTPVMEGEMTLITANHLKTRLEALGATITLLRSSNAPVTNKTAQDFEEYAKTKLGDSTPEKVQSLAKRLFYRTSEIRARAKKVNHEIHPDLVLCLHFNAESWGNPFDPQLSDNNHFHLLLNGAYTSGEVAHDDERFEMLLKILQRIHPEEKALATDLAAAFKELTALPPYKYKPFSLRALPLDDDSYIWARNLLANRLYECPVLFFEPYVMNSIDVHARAQAGDYEGLQTVNGQERQSIYREYAEAVTLGLERYYRKHRTP